MKHFKHIKSILFTTALIMLYGCGEKQYTIVTNNYIEDKVITLSELIKQKGNIKLDVPADANLKYYMEIEMPEAGVSQPILKNIQDSIKKDIFIDYTFATDPNGLTLNIEQAIKSNQELWKANYLDDCLEKMEEYMQVHSQEGHEEHEEYEEYLPILSMEHIVTAKPFSTYKNLFTYFINTYSYTGGAHGSTFYIYSVFDLKTGNKIELKDIVTEEGIAKLPNLIYKYLPKQKDENGEQLYSIDDLFEPNRPIEPSQNFYLTEKGICFVYNQYEIAPYSVGIINISIPMKEIEYYLKDSIK